MVRVFVIGERQLLADSRRSGTPYQRVFCVRGTATYGRLCPFPIPTAAVDREDVERQVTCRNTSYIIF